MTCHQRLPLWLHSIYLCVVILWSTWWLAVNPGECRWSGYGERSQWQVMTAEYTWSSQSGTLLLQVIWVATPGSGLIYCYHSQWISTNFSVYLAMPHIGIPPTNTRLWRIPGALTTKPNIYHIDDLIAVNSPSSKNSLRPTFCIILSLHVAKRQLNLKYQVKSQPLHSNHDWVL